MADSGAQCFKKHPDDDYLATKTLSQFQKKMTVSTPFDKQNAKCNKQEDQN